MPEQIGRVLWLGLGFTFHPADSLLHPSYLPYSYVCGWKLSDITFNWVVYCFGFDLQQEVSEVLYIYLIRVMCL